MEMRTDEMSRVPASRSVQSYSRIRQVWDVLGQPKGTLGEFPGGPVVKNPPSNSGDLGSTPGWGSKIPPAMGQLNLSAECHNKRYRMSQLRPCTATPQKGGVSFLTKVPS